MRLWALGCKKGASGFEVSGFGTGLHRALGLFRVFRAFRVFGSIGFRV